MSLTPTPTSPSFNGWNAQYLDGLYQQWKQDPASIEQGLQAFFQGYDLAQAQDPAAGVAAQSARVAPGSPASLLLSYREHGHLCAKIDPLGAERDRPSSLSPAAHGFSAGDLKQPCDLGYLGAMPLEDAIAALEETYCASIGVETAHVTSEVERDWIAHRIEPSRNNAKLSNPQRAHVLYLLHRAELFEKFCGRRYPGVKRFSLEGGESLIPLLDQMVERAGDQYGVEEIVMGMSHRGRLNVLINIVGKEYEQVFTEFDDAWAKDAQDGGGDVKYHRGYSANRILPSGNQVWLSMTSNPSHLEAVAPVAIGRARAKQRLRGDIAREKVVPIVLHGDAAFIGQGIVAETFTCSNLPGYTAGGTVHVVVNNQIGFTTGQEDARSSRYCTDMAKIVEAPVIHVNGEDPEAVVQAAMIAVDYRMQFKKDIVIDLICYRRHGHNETDEAMFTQPLLYKAIKSKPSVVRTYAAYLRDQGVITDADVAQIESDLNSKLDDAFERARKTPVDPTPNPGHRRWEGLRGGWSFDTTYTGISQELVTEIANAQSTWPADFEPHKKLQKVLKERTRAILENEPVDWATGEALAIGSLLTDGNIVRFSGQDCRRGTFSHRHAILRDVNNASTYCPLNHIHTLADPATPGHDIGSLDDNGLPRQAKLCIYDSPLSEYAVMGFEYGFSLAAPHILAIWEAQFGDFCNGAQVIIDQFLASAEQKWNRWSGLTLLLPHGYEGQGPEHSSARLERFLKLCGQNNMQVVHPTTPSQYFHMLRRQIHRPFRKPLIVMTPKSLLRLPECKSPIAEFTTGSFQEILDDPAFLDGATSRNGVSRVIMCSGKVYYDLIKRRAETQRNDIAILRVEQLYPLHTELLNEIRTRYPQDAQLMWVQEEPKNAGAYGHMVLTLQETLGWTMDYAGRPYSGTPATGSPSVHNRQLEEFLTAAIDNAPKASPSRPKPGKDSKKPAVA